ncbi:Conserved hypothetical protein [Clostridium neonatale]|uniref:hypothetical protein n=1 Tax=Clostridium neonatale TaxID=137838 RepID=UPI00291BD542|nr:hypothetical protein [Clostridium neonatale]CAI3243366.1 Conserved hypothetical protein [Clostridium neonatale]
MRYTKKRIFICVFIFIVFPLLVLGCQEEKISSNNAAEVIQLGKGAVLKSEEGQYNIYNYRDYKYYKVDTQSTILAYDKSSNSYICIEHGKHFIVYNHNKYIIKDEKYEGLKLSPHGKYISYFVDDNGLKLKVFKNDEKNSEIDINSDVSISGTLYDWYDDNTIVYYGVKSDKTNGLFTYNLITNKEELIYALEEGYLAYLKGTGDNLLFLQINLENDKELVAIDKKNKNCNILSNEIEELNDVISLNGNFYFTGKMKDDSKSLYKIEENDIKRLVFDFPAVINAEKGLKADSEGNILFVGKNDIYSEYEKIYSYNKDKSVSVVSDEAIDYVFIDYRE